MLTAADELHVHQTPEPIAAAGTDRNFYDRSYFGAFTPDGSLFVAGAFGIYPHLNVADAHVAVVRDGTQHCLHASKVLHADRLDLGVGPVRIEIEQPLHAIRLRVAEHDGIAADLRFAGRHFPVEEPRFMHRVGTRAFMDYTRLSQGARVTGWASVDGERLDLGDDALGFRDRSWGIRPVGAPDPQPPAPAEAPQFFWLWAPVHLGDRTTFWHLNADAAGRAWNTRAVVCPDGADAASLLHAHGRADLDLEPGTRWPQRATLDVEGDDLAPFTLAYEPLAHLEMQGIGYRHPEWSHGVLRGELEVAREDIDLAASDPGEPHRWHRQLLSRVTCTHEDGRTETGTGLFEHLMIGPSRPHGLT